MRGHDRASRAVAQIVMPARRVVDRVLAAPACAPLQTAQLVNQLGVIQEFDLPGVQKRQQIPVQIRAHLVPQRILDAMSAKAFSQPLAAVPVACYGVAAELRCQLDKLLCYVLRAERRPYLTDTIEHKPAAFRMCDGQRHRVLLTAGRVHKGVAPDARHWRELAPLGDHARVNRFTGDEGFNIAPELCAVLRRGRGLVGRISVGDYVRGNGRIHRQRGRPSHLHRITVLAKVRPIGPVPFTPARIGAADAH